MSKSEVTIPAPAKLNLTLEVLKKRADGYHEIKSVLQTLSLSDNFYFRAAETWEFKCNLPDWSAEKSLAFRAADLMQKKFSSVRGAAIEISKHIPLSSGLGGDSSDAAAVLCGLNTLWDLELPLSELWEIAARLGSDVPLFLYQGTLLAEGRGEIITPLPAMPHMSVVLLIPPIRLENKTRQLYSWLTPANFSSGKISLDLASMLVNKDKLPGNYLFNVFDSVGQNFFPTLIEYQQRFQEAGAGEIHLAGSGPTLFTLEVDRERAIRIYTFLLKRGQTTFLTDF
jgi:4-diphosphocytidyl-2-C-methyl-D-erythritol kinase